MYVAILANIVIRVPSDALRQISLSLLNFKSYVDYNFRVKIKIKGQNFPLRIKNTHSAVTIQPQIT